MINKPKIKSAIHLDGVFVIFYKNLRILREIWGKAQCHPVHLDGVGVFVLYAALKVDLIIGINAYQQYSIE